MERNNPFKPELKRTTIDTFEWTIEEKWQRLEMVRVYPRPEGRPILLAHYNGEVWRVENQIASHVLHLRETTVEELAALHEYAARLAGPSAEQKASDYLKRFLGGSEMQRIALWYGYRKLLPGGQVTPMELLTIAPQIYEALAHDRELPAMTDELKAFFARWLSQQDGDIREWETEEGKEWADAVMASYEKYRAPLGTKSKET